MPSPSAALFCPGITEAVELLQPVNAPSMKMSNVGFLESLLTDVNRAGLSPAAGKLSRDGHTMEWTVTATQRRTPDDVSEEAECLAGETPVAISQTILSDEIATDALSFSYADITKFCAEYTSGGAQLGTMPGTFMNGMVRQIMTMMDALRMKIDRKLLTLALPTIRQATAGYPQGFVALDMIDGANGGAALQSAYSTIGRNTDDASMGKPLIFIGQGVVSDWFRQLGIGCCNNIGGDLSKIVSAGQYLYFNDQNGDLILDTDNFFVYEPSAYQFLYQTLNEGANFGQIENSFYFTMPDPKIPGLFYDAIYTEKACGDNLQPSVSLQLISRFGLFATMDDAYSSTDPLFNFQGSLGYLGQTVA